MTTPTETTSVPTTDDRPRLEHRRGSMNAIAAVWAVLRRELGARIPTSGYVWSSLIFAAFAFASPYLTSLGGSDDGTVRVAVTSEGQQLTETLHANGIDVETTSSQHDAKALLRNENVDAVLVRAAAGAEGWTLLGDTSISPASLDAVQSAVTTWQLTAVARDAGVSSNELAVAAEQSTVRPELLDPDGDNMPEILFALGSGAVIVFVILLWGATMAADVTQEKATRVVEIIIATITPWQLLTGKVFAITIVGLLQVAIALAAVYAGLELFADGLGLSFLSPHVLTAGIIAVVIGVPLLAMLMAAMAARVEHADDLGTATQPVYLLLMAPFAAAVFAVFRAPDGLAMQILSLAPVTNLFAMPARIATETVPAWELGTSAAMALLAFAASVFIAGRIYSGSILRAGGTVSLRQSLASQ